MSLAAQSSSMQCSRTQSSRISSAACLAAILTLARGAGAAEDWLSLTGSAGCPGDRDELAAQILGAVVGAPNQDVEVEVMLAEGVRDTTAVVRVRLGSEVVGTKRLVAPACPDALSAVVAVVALALSSERAARGSISAEPGQTEVAAPRASARAREPWRASAAPSSPTASHALDRGVTRGEPPSGESGFSVLVAGGVDTGTLDEATAVAGAGAALNIGRGELRAIVWYGVPSYREEVSAGFESLRVDFAAAALDYCSGLDAARWVSLCGGLELGFERSSRASQVGDQPRTESEHIEPSLGAVAGLLLAQRALPFSPQLHLAAHVPMAFERSPTSELGFRCAFGASLQF